MIRHIVRRASLWCVEGLDLGNQIGEGSKCAAAALLSARNGFEVLAIQDTHPIQALGAISHPTNE